ncbi:MAG: hypothetical protein SPK50_03840 [Mobiluncus porci]|uniref:Uncharacterized protein n=1 Tax=Mobiluncus porci TaxID=2652278 RepID=A0A7K0K1E7_9ACTO|nr:MULTISPECIES: hypothetical protein [Mobiluncus]MCI6584316.1 hypothetical protein [Mobiluncus sp.]MDD7540684.1 hypothetical protein [Mobiluncus porci]MDY5748247.1 hypothetical protein [Mobiluncus porci]MST49311.1 hypothetical protein [Mobiluncus porci]
MTPDPKNGDGLETSETEISHATDEPKDLEALVSGQSESKLGSGRATKVLVGLMGLLFLGGVVFAVVLTFL